MNAEIAKLVARRVEAGCGTVREVVSSGFIQAAICRQSQSDAQRIYDEHIDRLEAPLALTSGKG